MSDRNVTHSKEGMLPLNIGPLMDKVVIEEDGKRYEGYGDSEEEAYRNARAKESADDDEGDH
jgi:hypothetical protein